MRLILLMGFWLVGCSGATKPPGGKDAGGVSDGNADVSVGDADVSVGDADVSVGDAAPNGDGADVSDGAVDRGGADVAGDGVPDRPSQGDGPPAPDLVLGGFAVQLVPPSATNSSPITIVSGSVYDAPRLTGIIMTTVEEAGGCKLRTPRVPLCTVPCGSVAVCVADDTCRPYPNPQNVGAVEVRGVGNAVFVMEPIAGQYQPPSGLTSPYPPFAEGAEVSFKTAGGAHGPFVLLGKGIAPLAITSGSPMPARSDQPLAIRWTAPGPASDARIHVRVDVSHHGGLRGDIECDVADTGSLEIPASMVGKLLALGVAGFPKLSVSRTSVTSADVPRGQVILLIASAVDVALALPGLISCRDDANCPTGRICRPDLTCS